MILYRQTKMNMLSRIYVHSWMQQIQHDTTIQHQLSRVLLAPPLLQMSLPTQVIAWPHMKFYITFKFLHIRRCLVWHVFSQDQLQIIHWCPGKLKHRSRKVGERWCDFNIIWQGFNADSSFSYYTCWTVDPHHYLVIPRAPLSNT